MSVYIFNLKTLTTDGRKKRIAKISFLKEKKRPAKRKERRKERRKDDE